MTTCAPLVGCSWHVGTEVVVRLEAGAVSDDALVDAIRSEFALYTQMQSGEQATKFR